MRLNLPIEQANIQFSHQYNTLIIVVSLMNFNVLFKQGFSNPFSLQIYKCLSCCDVVEAGENK